MTRSASQLHGWLFTLEVCLSRKNLSRTVIEGGRRYSNSYFRRASHGTARARTRDWLDHIIDDVDGADATDPRPLPRVQKQFHDKLGPAQRWLDAQAGRPWNKVYSELRTKFDSRTLAGKHIVDDHMIGMVRRAGESTHYWSNRTLVVDRDGILRKPPGYGHSYSKLRKRADGWAENRVCTLTFTGWRWVRRIPKGAPCPSGYACSHAKHENFAGIRYHGFLWEDLGAMTRSDVKRLDRFPTEMRARFVIANPWAR
ncbi:MAG: hypothetical protein ACKV2T_05940 [Kofleriaceae bacterium]